MYATSFYIILAVFVKDLYGYIVVLITDLLNIYVIISVVPVIQSSSHFFQNKNRLIY